MRICDAEPVEIRRGGRIAFTSYPHLEGICKGHGEGIC
jgi:hypothetical protein